MVSHSPDVGINYPSEYSRRCAVDFARATRRETSRTNQVVRFVAPTTGRARYALSALDDLMLSTSNDRLFTLVQST